MPTAPKAPEAAVHANLATALAAFQADLPSVAKGNTAKVPTKAGGSYSYDYADLTDVSAAILPALAKQGLAWLTALDTADDGNIVLRWELMHGASNEQVSGKVPVGRAGQDWQTLGGAVTYARRYCLVAATGVAPGGDDNDGADARAGAPRQQAQPRPQAAIPAASGPLPDDLYRLSSLTSLDDVKAMWRQAAGAGHLGLTIPVADEQGTLVDRPFSDVLTILANRFKAADPEAQEAAAVAAHEATLTAQAPRADEDAPEGDR